MASIREQILTNAKIGSIEFVASLATGGGSRRLVQYNAIGVDGAELEDLGEEAKTEILRARLDEDVYQRLDSMRREAKIVQCVHPLFGVFQGRIAEMTYEAGPKTKVEATITLVEDGQYTVQLAPTTLSLTDASSAFNAGLDEIDGLEMPAEWTDIQDTYNVDMDLFDTFANTLEDVLSGQRRWTDLGSVFDEMASTVTNIVDAVDGTIDILGQAGAEMMDISLNLANQARQCVDAAQNEMATLWEPFIIDSPVSVAEICREFLGGDDEDVIDLLLDSNPNIIDLNSIVQGMELLIPVQV